MTSQAKFVVALRSARCPCMHVRAVWVYLEAARIGEDRRVPLFRSCEPGRRDALQVDGAVNARLRG